MLALDVAMKVGPAKARTVTRFFGTVVPQKKGGVIADFLIVVLDAKRVVRGNNIGRLEILVTFVGVLRENDKLRLGLCRVSKLESRIAC